MIILERILNRNEDAGVGFELTLQQFEETGEKQQLLSVHKNGKVRRVNPEVTTQAEVFESADNWWKRQNWDKYQK